MEESADLQMTVWALQDRYLRLYESSLEVRKVLEAIIAELLAACKAADLYLDAIAKAKSEIDA